MIRPWHWLMAAVVAIVLHGVILGFAAPSSEVEMERSAGQPGAVWGMPVEAIADTVETASVSAKQVDQVDSDETTETDTSEVAEKVEAEPTENVEMQDTPDRPDVAETAKPVDAETPDPVSLKDFKPVEAVVETASIDEVEPMESPAVEAWQGGVAVVAVQAPVESASEPVREVEVAALTPVVHTEPLEAEDITVPVPRTRPLDVPRVEASPKPQRSKTTKARKAKPTKKKTAKSSKSPSRAAGQRPSAAPAGENAGTGGVRRADSGRKALSSYAGRIASHLRRYKRYPRDPNAKRLTATATITFTIGADGRVRSSRVSRRSGVSMFDREVAAMVSRAAPFPPIPATIGRKAMTFTVPIRFKPR